MAQRQSPKPQDPKEATWARLSRTASFWILVILLPALLLNLMRGREQPRFESRGYLQAEGKDAKVPNW